MLGKVFKYDFKATVRYFVPMYVILAVLTVFNKLFMELVPYNNKNYVATSFKTAFLVFYIISLVCVFLLTYVFLTIHFYKRMTGDEAYLTFTLPIKITTQINAKVYIAAFWSLITSLVVGISFLILAAGHGIIDFFGKICSLIQSYQYSGSIIIFIILLILACILSMFYSFLMIYAAISIGHLFGKYRIIGAVGAYMGFYTILQVISILIMSVSGFFRYSNYRNDFDFLRFFNGYMFYSLVFSTIVTVIYYIITVYVFGKKLNLE